MKLSHEFLKGNPVIHRGERGQILVLTALLLVLMVGMGALSVDVGFYLHERQNVENAVDAGALAGAAYLPNNGVAAVAAATQFALANDHGLTAAQVNVSFRCLVSSVATGVPGSCDPKGDALWTKSASTGLQVSPCVPANGDVCNVIIVTASNTQKFFLAPAIGIKSKSTGSVTSAACRGTCGAPPSTPVDVVLIMDRTGSMSSTDLANARAAATAMFQAWDAKLQWVALGLLGPSDTSSQSAASAPCLGSPAVYVKGASTGQYDTTTVAKWVPVGLTGVGATGANRLNENYLNANGTLNTGSHVVNAINCFNTSSTGTNLATPMKMAKDFLLANGRAGARKGIIFETDGTPNLSGTNDPTNYTCAQANAEALAAKTAGIEIYTIGFGLAGTDVCPDASGAYKNAVTTKVLADMATSSVDRGCTAAANTDGDHAYCLPKTQQLTSIFQAVAGNLAAGSNLVTVP
jgi:hypothetical protein